MVYRNEEEVKYIDMIPVIQSDIFVNEEYRGATISNIGRYLELPNTSEFQVRACEKLAEINAQEENEMVRKLTPKNGQKE